MAFTIFSGSLVHDEYRERAASLRETIDAEDRLYVLRVDDESYLAHLMSRFQLDVPTLHFDQVSIGAGKAQRIVYDVGHSMQKWTDAHAESDGVELRIPFTGDPQLLMRRPNRRVASFEVEVELEEVQGG